MSIAKLGAYGLLATGAGLCVAGLWFGPRVSALGLFLGLSGAVLRNRDYVTANA